MRIGVTSQNFRTITGHAGKTRRFLIYEATASEPPQEIERLDLPQDQSLHAYAGEDHPILQLDALITASCGAGFIHRLGRHGVRVVATSATDPKTAVQALARGQALPEPLPQEHHHGPAAGRASPSGRARDTGTATVASPESE